MRKRKYLIPQHLVTVTDYTYAIRVLKKPKKIDITEHIDFVTITVTRTFWQYWTTFSKNYKRDIESMIGTRKAVGLQVEVIVE